MRIRPLSAAMSIGMLLTTSAFAAENPPRTAEATVTRTFALLKAGDIKEAARYVASESITASLNQIAEMLKSGQFAALAMGGKEDGDLAVVVVKVTLKVNDKERVRYECDPFMRKDGVWRLHQSASEMKLDAPARERMASLEKWGEDICVHLRLKDMQTPPRK